MKTPWELLAKYYTNEATKDERIEVENWLNHAEDNLLLFETLAHFFKKSTNPDFIQFKEKDWEVLYKKTVLTDTHKSIWLPIWKIAATISLVFVAFISVIYLNKQTVLLEIVSTDHTKEVWLPDSSYVLLNKNSKLIVEAGYLKKERNVKLIGEAFFQVKPNHKSPFSVSSFDICTTVLGTQFNVSATTDSLITVSVLEGKVNVAINEARHLLTANMATTYDGHHLQMITEADPNFLTWKTGIMRFDRQPLAVVTKFLSAYFKEEVILEKNIDTGLMITVELNNLSLQQSLEIITATLDLNYSKQPKGYLIQ